MMTDIERRIFLQILRNQETILASLWHIGPSYREMITKNRVATIKLIESIGDDQ